MERRGFIGGLIGASVLALTGARPNEESLNAPVRLIWVGVEAGTRAEPSAWDKIHSKIEVLVKQGRPPLQMKEENKWAEFYAGLRERDTDIDQQYFMLRADANSPGELEVCRLGPSGWEGC